MKRNARSIVQIGDLVAAVFDSAVHDSVDPLVVSRLATRSLGHLLGHAPAPDYLQPFRVGVRALKPQFASDGVRYGSFDD